MPSWRHSAGISHLQPVNQNHMYMFTQQYTCCQLWNLRCFISSFLCVLWKNRYPGIEYFIVLSSPEIFALLFLLKEVKLHPPAPLQPDRKMIKRLTFEIIWQLASATTTFSLKVVVEWRWLTPLHVKLTLPHERTLLSIKKIRYS